MLPWSMKTSRSNRPALFISCTALLLAVAGAGGPVIAKAFDANNADKVDGKHAVSSGATVGQRKGKLVATSATTGKLPTSLIDSKAFFPTKVPLGAQLAGYWRIDVQTMSGDNGDWHEAISFGGKMPGALDAETIKEYPSTSANCPGTVEAPSAKPGYLCFYYWYHAGAVTLNTITGYADGPYGGAIAFNATGGGGDAYAAGTWAARAPLTVAPRSVMRSSKVSPGVK